MTTTDQPQSVEEARDGALVLGVVPPCHRCGSTVRHVPSCSLVTDLAALEQAVRRDEAEVWVIRAATREARYARLVEAAQVVADRPCEHERGRCMVCNYDYCEPDAPEGVRCRGCALRAALDDAGEPDACPPPTTTEQIAAGPELDAAIAEKVMGMEAWTDKRGGYTHVVWVPSGDKPWDGIHRDHQHPERYARIEVADIDPHKHIEHRSWPSYSTTWEGAGLVVERMRELGWAVIVLSSASPGGSMATIEGGHGKVAGQGLGPTGPEAICRAALAALA